MSTVGSLLDRVQRNLLSGVVEDRNKLASPVTDSDDTFVMLYELNGLRPGTIFEVGTELVFVWNAVAGTKTLTVERGYLGTIPTAHDAGAVVVLNPRFPRSQAFDAFQQDVDDLSSPMHGLFRVGTVDLAYNGSDRQIDLNVSGQVIDLIDVRLRYLSDDYPVLRAVRLQRDLPTADFPSGKALVFDEGTIAGTLRVRYRAPFTRAVTVSSDIQAVCGIPESMEDILEMGVQARLLATREVKRNFLEAQGDTRRAEEVQSGGMQSSHQNMLRLRRDRIIAEAARLGRQYPLTIRV